MKNVKRLVSVLLCVVTMFTLLTVVSFAGETTIEQAISDGKLLDFIGMLFSNVDWSSILTILVQTVKTVFSMIGISL